MKIQLLISYSGTEKAGAKNGETVDQKRRINDF